MLKRMWADPVWSKVIAGMILAAVASIGTYRAGWWPRIGSLALRLSALAKSSTLVPNWLLVILTLCAITVVIIVAFAIWIVIATPSSGVTFRDYSEDLLLGILWRWRYGRDGFIFDLYSFCPKCDYQIYPRQRGDYRIEYRCEHCGNRVEGVSTSVEEIESRVTRLIQKKIRDGSWSQVVHAQAVPSTEKP